MGSVNLVVIVEAVRTIITHKSTDSDVNDLHIPSLIAVGAALGTSGFLRSLYIVNV